MDFVLPSRGLDIEDDGRPIHVETVGDGPLIFFVHGYLLSGQLWRATAERIAPAGWRCIMPDLRGHGRSEPTTAATIASYADDMVAMLDALGETQPVVLVGLSLGGIIGMEFVQRYRPRLRALAIVCARANAETELGRKRWNGLIRLIEREGSRAAADAFVERVFAPGVDRAMKNRLYDDILAMPPQGAVAAARALSARRDYRPTLPQIDCPTLVVAGAEDTVTSTETMQHIHAQIPGSRYAAIARAAHLPPAEQPDAFAKELLALLRGL